MVRAVAVAAIIACSFLAAAPAASAQGDPARAFDAATATQRKPGTHVRIDLIGDSTQTDNAGYGRGFCANFTPEVDCLNFARGGASTRTFRELGQWDKAVATKPDYMVIQFGHNDTVTKEHLDRQVALPDYKANLKRFVLEARGIGAVPVLVTPLTRRYFGPDAKIHSDLTEYSDAMREVAREMNVPLIDLQTESIAFLNKIGETEGSKLGITKKDTDGKTVPDKTHLNWAGSYAFGRMVAAGLGQKVPALKRYVLKKPADLPVAGQKAMKVFEGGPVTIVLVGDSTTAPQGGWGPGFCAVMTPSVKCIDTALNGRSTRSFVDEGHWKDALALHGDYYLIQFGHNDQKLQDPKRGATPEQFAANLHKYIADVRAIGAIPVLITPLSRRSFVNGKIKQDLDEYAAATRKVAAEENITCIDLNGMSTRLLNTMDQAGADTFNATGHEDQRAENGKKTIDRTHLNEKGKAVFGRMVADNLVRTQVELGPDLIGAPASAAAAALPQQAAPTDGK